MLRQKYELRFFMEDWQPASRSLVRQAIVKAGMDWADADAKLDRGETVNVSFVAFRRAKQSEIEDENG